MDKSCNTLSESSASKSRRKPTNNKVLIVDEHPLIRLALHTCLSRHGLERIAEARDGREAIRYIHQHEPDLMITELDLPTLSGLVVLEHIKQLALPIKTLVFSAHTSRLSIMNCALAGAHGFVSKAQEVSALSMALLRVRNGETFYPDWVERERAQSVDDPMRGLSVRERQVLQLLSEGMSNMQVAERMQLSDKTVSTFKTRSLRKLNAKSVVEIVHRFK
ncbi:response regulator transcription factor [Pseudomonas sp. Sample_16]|uniref:response regulator transcription factor n=1 Tax=Pseudomonas sp. Sample_16 TaxID=2448263 RepID=UPI0010329F31|nr:response regulator transcription factor [Pseudomonas sp. Sample_16]